MELTPGYKQTQVGLIPADWEVQAIHEFATIKTGPFGTLLKAAEYAEGDGVPLISVGEIREGFLNITDHTPRVPKTVTRRLPQYVLRHGDIVFGRKGGVERSALIRENQAGWFLGSDGISIRPVETCNQEYLSFQFQSARIQRWLIQHAIGTTMPSLNQQILRDVVIPLPQSKAEQEAIAEALTDADALIDSLEQLLAKKRLIKQGAMQELLTGKKRLPGFCDVWRHVPLRDVLMVCHGRNQHSIEDSSGIYPILASGGLIGKTNCFLHDKASVLIGRKGTIDKPQYMETPFWTVDTLFYTIVSPGNSAKFLYYRFCLIDWRVHSEASGVPSLNAKTIEQIQIQIPNENEQIAIASVLSDMDADIAAIEAQLAKSRRLKQAMMQELLTGRIRLCPAGIHSKAFSANG